MTFDNVRATLRSIFPRRPNAGPDPNGSDHEAVSRRDHLHHVLRPPANWREIVETFENGTYFFPVPGRPDARKGAPWPVEWTLTRILDVEEERQMGRTIGEDGKWWGWKIVTATCVETGAHLDVDTGIRCARCRDPIAKSRGYRDLQTTPYCNLCRARVGLIRHA